MGEGGGGEETGLHDGLGYIHNILHFHGRSSCRAVMCSDWTLVEIGKSRERGAEFPWPLENWCASLAKNKNAAL